MGKLFLAAGLLAVAMAVAGCGGGEPAGEARPDERGRQEHEDDGGRKPG